MRFRPIIALIFFALLAIIVYTASPVPSDGINRDLTVDALLIIFFGMMLLWFAIVLVADRRRRLVFSPPSTVQFDTEDLSSFFMQSSLLEEPRVPIAALEQLGLPIEETTYLAIGGGLGSFVWVNVLRICGAKPEQIVVLGPSPNPYENYRWLCRNSQLFDEDRLRSDSGSTPDNVWGWPGYAVREAWQCLMKGQLSRALGVMWQIFAEPVLTETYTPRSSDVFKSIDREAARIGWESMHCTGFGYRIRKTDDDRYVVLYTQPGQQPHMMVARYIHLSTGYSGMHVLPDLRQYRERTGDYYRAVQAYEEHSHIYQQLIDKGGTVLIRGRGIVASQVIQRLYEARAENPEIRILHLMREPHVGSKQIGRARSIIESHWRLQPFNWPKSAFGGHRRAQWAQIDESDRAYFFDMLGGVTTANRRMWRATIEAGQREGWYQVFFGSVSRIENENERLVVTICDKSGQECALFAVNYLIDATGLEANLDQNTLLADLREHYSLDLNSQKRLSVNDTFEIQRLRNGTGRVFAAGIITAGGTYGPVDSFTGLLYAAQRSVTSLVEQGAPNLRDLNGLYSVIQWVRWCWGAQP